MNIDTITELAQAHITGYMGLLLYWLPLVVCVFGYTLRTWLNYQSDLLERELAEKSRREAVGTPAEKQPPWVSSIRIYAPTDTIGTLIGRALVSVVPVANLWASVFDLGPKIFGRFFKWIGNVFDQPLVPRIKKDSQQ